MGIYEVASGAQGEEQATEFLKKKGYKILEKNYKNKLGEIDIIAKFKDYICFIEVKTRSTLFSGRPCEAVTVPKQRKIKMTALVYLKLKGLTESDVRFDVVEILDDEISLIENAF